MEDCVMWGMVIGVPTGLFIGVVLTLLIICCRLIYHNISEMSSCSRNRNLAIQEMSLKSVSARQDFNIVQDCPRRSVTSACGVPKFTFKDLRNATDDFGTIIGKGAFGSVYRAEMATGEIYAVKVLDSNSSQGKIEFSAEVVLLSRLHHKNQVNLVGYSAEKGNHMLVYVYMSNGSLFSHLYDEGREVLNWDLRVRIALDVARGLEYLHYGAVPTIVHRDIKSSNILLDQSMRARVADFGLSTHETINSCSSSLKGTYGYLDPEYMSTKNYTKKSDVYSFGVLLFELISGRNPLQGLMEYVEVAAIDGGWGEITDASLDGRFDVKEFNAIAAIAYKCINPIARKRPSLRNIVQKLYWTCKMRHSSTKNLNQNMCTHVEEPCFQLDLPRSHDCSSTER